MESTIAIQTKKEQITISNTGHKRSIKFLKIRLRRIRTHEGVIKSHRSKPFQNFKLNGKVNCSITSTNTPCLILPDRFLDVKQLLPLL